jgi:predicted DNA-binding transcriptional regulator AlpA
MTHRSTERDAFRARANPLLSHLDENVRLYVPDLMHLFQCSQQTLFERIRSGEYPKPYRIEGCRPYWKTSTLLPYFPDTGEKP